MQWLLPGMTEAVVRAGGKDRKGEPTEVLKLGREILRLREERAKAQ